ncbi:Excinuclease ABC subunit C [Fructilactobacillus florum 8D]|uniref:UvrABC system protein C n=1 Tax=Fructilactobacillus florum 8D TaxID=1221538 RepID=W9EK31_9LACO|nr:excinuclease ABC subunit UvrC [Fructilactobacillus florum]EKK20275.1 Excinuclease ABC subunit C [Fructilactobacillus florum 2F]ETO40034.1 Excinuclease ABC subunit C [Fructilactobacillus florum 8D]
MASKYIEDKLTLLPEKPGVYIMKDRNGKVIYVGKSKNLKNRVRSYFKSRQVGRREKLVNNIADYETIITANDKEAFLLEITLIQKYRPYYNVSLKNGSGGYPYIKITNERNPKMLVTSFQRHDGAYYYGPYPNIYAADETLKFLQKMYPLRRCNGYQGRPCLYYHMGQCLGSCFKTVPKQAYQQQIKQIKSFLNGNVIQAKQLLQQRMETAAAQQEYERAAELRDQLRYIQATVEKQKIISNDYTQRDIFNFYADHGWLSIQIFYIRQARLMKRTKRLFPIVSTSEEEVTNFIVQFYNQKQQLKPVEILVPSEIDPEIIYQLTKIPTRVPQRGQKRALLQMARENAKYVLDEKFRLLELNQQKTTGAMTELQQALNLSQLNRIEAFDHSHLDGADLVSAMVVFENGKPNKNKYRKYKLRTVDHADETASTKEVIRRRYTRLLKEHADLPDLILMDGGEIQMNAVKDVLENELALEIPVAGMVKNSKHRTADLLYGDQDEHVALNPQSQAFYLVQRVQDEVHRFAISFHHELHSKNSMTSRLDNIKGVGPKTRNKLLRNFGSMKNIENASVVELQQLGISKTVAQTIKYTFAKTTPMAKMRKA